MQMNLIFVLKPPNVFFPPTPKFYFTETAITFIALAFVMIISSPCTVYLNDVLSCYISGVGT